jgi:hypothetical protein
MMIIEHTHIPHTPIHSHDHNEVGHDEKPVQWTLEYTESDGGINLRKATGPLTYTNLPPPPPPLCEGFHGCFSVQWIHIEY